MRVLIIISILAGTLLLSSYYQDPNGLAFPDHFGDLQYDFSKNSYSDTKVELGRALFYDPILSKDSTISCASCHSPFNAFAHTDHTLSHGIGDSIGTRNAPALFNLAWKSSFMWDGASNHLDMQALSPITHEDEMAESIEHVLDKLAQKPIYPTLFEAAFGDTMINTERMLKALSQFQLSLISVGSKYDKVKSGIDTFSTQESKGYSVFKEHCASCHTEPLFTDDQFRNNGLNPDSTLSDIGRAAVTLSDADRYKYKVPTLRNLSYTYPYMHDGRFRKLYDVINHYTDSLDQALGIDPLLQSGIILSEHEKVDLVAFLLTLNDKDFVYNPDHRFPRELLKPTNL